MKITVDVGAIAKYFLCWVLVNGIHMLASAIEAMIRNWKALWNLDTWMDTAFKVLTEALKIFVDYGGWHHALVLGLVVLLFSVIKISE